jgi:hypothetical protein
MKLRFPRKIFPLLIVAGTGAALALLAKPFPAPASPATGGPSAETRAEWTQAANPTEERFLPLTPGTYWVYEGTVEWGADSDTEKSTTTKVTLTSKVERVYETPDFKLAVVTGFPSDQDWATGQVEPKRSLLIETRKHEVFLDALPPDFNFAKLEKDPAALANLISEDNVLFRWPLKKGLKFGDPESVRRDDGMYCWVVTEQQRKKFGEIKGLAGRQAEVFLLRYATNPDDTEMEVSPGIGVLSYEYHHHGTVANTSLSLVEFHSGEAANSSGDAK